MSNVTKLPQGASAKRRLTLINFDELQPKLISGALVKGLLTRGAMSVVFGESNCGKTFFVLDLSMHVAQGLAWRDRRVNQSAVIYVAAEGAFGIANRVAAYRQHHRVDESPPFFVLPVAIDLCDPHADTADFIATVLEACERFEIEPGLIVLDTASRVMAGGNENAPDDMGAFVQNCDRIREATGAHVLIIHHSGKDTTKGARGHSLLRAATDTEIEVTRDEEGTATATVTKQKELPTRGAFSFNLTVVEIGHDEDGDEVTSCVVTPSDFVAATRSQKPLTGIARIALEKLDDLLAREGVACPASDHVPRNATVVKRERFRQHLRDTGVADQDATGTERKQWKRVYEKLIETNHIASWQDWVWRIHG